MTFSPVATHSRCVLVESLNEDEFNNDAVGGIRNKSQPLLFVGVLSRPCPAQLPVSLLSMFLCPTPPQIITQRLALSMIFPLLSNWRKEEWLQTLSPCRVSLYSLFPKTPPTQTTKCLPPQISLPTSSL